MTYTVKWTDTVEQPNLVTPIGSGGLEVCSTYWEAFMRRHNTMPDCWDMYRWRTIGKLRTDGCEFALHLIGSGRLEVWTDD